MARHAPCDLSRNYILSYPGGPREGVSGCLIFLGVGASFRHEKRKIATRPFALGSNRMRLTFDDCVLDVARRELRRGSELIGVEPQVFDLLVYLAQNPDRIVTKDELLQAVWDGRVVSESAINNRLNAARRAIGDSGEAQRLCRARGFASSGRSRSSAPNRRRRPYRRILSALGVSLPPSSSLLLQRY